MRTPFLLLILTLWMAAPLAAQRPDSPRRGGFGRPSSGQEAAVDGEESKGSVKPYDEVIKENYKTLTGLFLVHQGDGKVFYEIPRGELDKDLLWVTQIAQTQSGFGYGGTSAGDRVVRWEVREEKVLLRDIKYQLRTEGDASLKLSVEGTSLAPIIKSFPVLAWGKDQRPVIDVTDLFLDDVSEFSAARRLGASGSDRSRSFMDDVKVFPGNLETKVLMTYRLSSGGNGGSAGESPRGPWPRGGESRRDPSQSGVTVQLHHSMVRLPAVPMTPRVHDARVGFFSVSFEDYGGEDQAVDTTRYIARWRLEKQDPTAEVSDPVKPIVFYVGRGVPEKWRPYVHQGIEKWQAAFAAAGFSNAIIAKDAPLPSEDPDWDAEDARYSTIRWLPSTVENAMGPHVNDPRSGEILEADIVVYHNVLKLARDWYFVQASPNDPSAQTLPLPDETLGKALAYVIAHEVGHTLGFPHNMKASSAYTVEQLRDPEFTALYGTEASIMDYGRFNYVAQPGDGANLIPIVGPYDFFAVDWGYRQYDSAEAETQGLRERVARQVDEPVLRFGDPNASEDPTQQTEDLGSDPVAATALGLANLDRVASYLIAACCKENEDYSLLENMYGELVGQRNRELMHVANVVGGVVRSNLWYGDADAVFQPLPRERQKAAVAFLNRHAFQVPQSLLQPDLLQRLQADGVSQRILASQKSLLGTLINEARTLRMTENASGVKDAYTPLEMLGDLREGIWSELAKRPTSIDLYRRNLQRAHVELLTAQVGATEFPS
ncbi:MAG: zinc-dependent metalloprotease, partial [Planctomycetota bacterium]|nr:zinc-dependent metalloprotease [Planctomycetota bacterium]